MRRFRRVLGLRFPAIRHRSFLPLQTSLDCRNRRGWRQRLPLDMRRIKYTPPGSTGVGWSVPATRCKRWTGWQTISWWFLGRPGPPSAHPHQVFVGLWGRLVIAAIALLALTG